MSDAREWRAWWQQHWMLAVLLGVAAALRFTGLGHESFWVDEIATWRCVTLPTIADILRYCARDVQAPGYMLILRVLLPILGTSEAGLRFPSAVAGVAGVWLIYRLGRELYGPRHGIVAALLTTVFWLPIRYSQEARTYAILFAVINATSLLWIKIARDAAQGRTLSRTQVVTYAALSLLQAYLHYYGLYVVLIQGMAALALAMILREKVGKVALCYAAIALGYMPWLPAALGQFERSGGHWIVRPGLITLWELALLLFNENVWIAVLGLCTVGLAVGRWAATTNWSGRRTLRDWATTLLLEPVPVLVLWVVSIGVPITLFSRFFIPLMIPRYLLFLYIPIYLLLADGLLSFGGKTSATLVALMVVLLLVDLFWRQEYYTRPHNMQFREATAYIAEREQHYPNSAIVAYSWNNADLDLYLERHGALLRTSGLVGTLDDLEQTLRLVDDGDVQFLWYISAWREPEPEFVEALAEHLQLRDTKEFVSVRVWLFEVP